MSHVAGGLIYKVFLNCKRFAQSSGPPDVGGLVVVSAYEPFPNPVDTAMGAPAAVRATFLADYLLVSGEETWEAYPANTLINGLLPAANGNVGTIVELAGTAPEATSRTNFGGLFNTTPPNPGGASFARMSSPDPNAFPPPWLSRYEFRFTAPGVLNQHNIAAFWFYMTDIGDIGGVVSVTLTKNAANGGGSITYDVPPQSATANPPGGLSFWGFADFSGAEYDHVIIRLLGTDLLDLETVAIDGVGFATRIGATTPEQLVAAPPTALFIDRLLLIGGGGGGGSGLIPGGGGGGAGRQAEYTDVFVTPGAYAVVVGAGGAINANGADSSFGGAAAWFTRGGGKGAVLADGFDGGSGGGAADGGAIGGLATGPGGTNALPSVAGGNDGGAGSVTAGGGGGGAGAAGTSGGGSGGAGGAGASNNISGAAVTRAGGGGGGSDTSFINAAGGVGGGGQGASAFGGATAGTPNTGSGGGGGSTAGAAAIGGSGLVVIRYTTADFGVCTGGTITTVGADTVHTFTADGVFTAVAP